MQETTQTTTSANEDPKAARPYGGELGAFICGGAAACLIGVMAILAVLEMHDARPLTPIASNLLTGVFQSLVLITVMVVNARRASAPLAYQQRQILATLAEMRRDQIESTKRERKLSVEVATLRSLVEDLAGQLIEERPTKEQLSRFEEAAVQALHGSGAKRPRQLRPTWSESTS